MSTVPAVTSNLKKYHLGLVLAAVVVTIVALLGFLVSIKAGIMLAIGAIMVVSLVRVLRMANHQVEAILREELPDCRRQDNAP